MSTFWWEETYDPNLKVDTSVKTRIPTDHSGEAFLKHRIPTSSSQLSGLITPDGALSIVLGDSGRIHSAVNCYSNATGAVTRSILVESKSGFMDLSSDGEILAVGVLKEDTIMVFHVPSGDYLASVRGGRPRGFWGQLQFIPGSINYLVEHRVTEMQKSTAKKSTLRLWDLGFRSHPSSGAQIKPGLVEALSLSSTIGNGDSLNGNGASRSSGGGGAASENENGEKPDEDSEDEDVDDEDAVQLWQFDMEGPACFAFNNSSGAILLNVENKRVIETYSATDGLPVASFKSPLPPKLRAIVDAHESSSTSASAAAPSAVKKPTKNTSGRMTATAAAKPSHGIKPSLIESESWSTKCVLSQNKKYFAIGHFGRVSIMDCATGAIVGEVFSPIEDDTYPLVPLAFILNDDFLVCRINYDRILMMMSWRLPKASSMVYALKDLGGTISDACAVSPDGKTLICWPFGSVEIYDLAKVADAMFLKYRKRLIIEFASIRSYLRRKLTAETRQSRLEGCKANKEKALFSFFCMNNQELFASVLSFL